MTNKKTKKLDIWNSHVCRDTNTND